MTAETTDLDDTSSQNNHRKLSKRNSECKVTYDELLSSAGEFGFYQVLLLIATLPFYMSGVYVYYTQMFITEVSQNHWCWIPELEHLTELERRDLAIPKDESMFGYSRCTAYVANWTEILETGQVPDDTWETTPCRHGWEFDKSEIPYPTISSELGWVCDRDVYQARAQSLASVGSIVGGFIIGWVADRFGRIPAAIISNLLGFIGGVSSSFATNFVQFAICRFIKGMGYDNCMVMVYLIILEYVAPKYRSLMANLSFAIFYSLFVTTLPFVALAAGHWKVISLATSLPLALAVVTPLLIPESPRWLLSKGRIEEAIKKVLLIGRINRKEIPPKLIDQFRTTMAKEEKEENVSLIDVLKTPVLRRVFILSCLAYMSTIVVFDGLIRSVSLFDFDYFLSFAAVSLTELPSMILLAFVLDFFGRRWLTVIVMSVSSVFSILIGFVGSGIQTLSYAMVARFAVNMAYGATAQWAAEVLPTGVRGSGIAFVHICGHVATVITPYIVYTNTYIYWLPLVIIAITAALGAVTALFLPETAKKDMPHTFEDAEYLATSQQFCEMPCIKQRKNSESIEQVNPGFET